MAPHGLIATITIALGAAFLGGFLASRLRLPPIVGYLAAGIAVGPFTPGLSADPQIAPELAEIGVILLMFGVGIQFSLRDLWSVRGVALAGATGQIVIATAITALVVPLWGWTYAQGIVFGLAISISSTVVLLRALSEVGLLDSVHGRIAVGWVIVEDLAIVVVLVLLPPFAPLLGGTAGGGENLFAGLAITLTKVALFGVLIVVVGTRLIPWLLAAVARTGSRELFTLAVLVVAIGVALVAALAFEVSLALGAFLAGVAISESDLSHQAAAEALPLRDAFAVLFFVSVGMLFDPTFLIREPLLVAAVVALVVVRKWLLATGFVLALGYPVRTALIVGAGLGQIGEFSFVLSELDRDLGILPAAAHDLIIAGALISITLNPLLFRSVDPIADRARQLPLLRRYEEHRAGALARLEREDEEKKLQRHAVICGHGRVGSLVMRALKRRNMECLVIEQDRRTVEALRQAGTLALYGDAGHELVLERAHLDRAILIVVALRDPQISRRIVQFARRANERIGIVARAHSKEAADYLRAAGANEVVLGEEELAIEMTGYALHRLGVSPQEIALIARGLRSR
jgi:CPA2 family monovalent cation:H+ antiporter-2